MSRRRKGVRPEHTAACGEAHYQEREALRYSTGPQTVEIQTELTKRAIELIDQGKPSLILDMGCGSALSGRVLSAQGLAWVGTDVSLNMLQRAAADTASAGHVILADMVQGISMRSAVFDAAVSISAVQWLCFGPQPLVAVQRLFADLWRVLRPGSCAALQVYTEDDAQSALLLRGAVGAGFTAGFFVDFPHDSPAKKYYVCLHKELPSAARAQLLSAHNCNVAWPRAGSCMLRWARHLRARVKAAAAGPPALMMARARMQQEHSQLGRRSLRLLRRALAAGDAPAEQQASGELVARRADRAQGPNMRHASIGTAAAQPSLGRQEDEGNNTALVIEAEVLHPGLMPCGGAIVVHITLPRGELTPVATPRLPGGEQPTAGISASHLHAAGPEGQLTGWEGAPGDDVDALPAAAAIVGRAVGERGAVLDCSVRTASADVAALMGVSWPAQLAAELQRSGPAPDEEDCFFWVEGLRHRRHPGSCPNPAFASNGDGSGVNGSSASADELRTAVLHARKLPQLLVLCMQHSGAVGAGGEETINAVVARISALCAQMNASVVAVDVHCGAGASWKGCSGGSAGLTSAWLLYVTGLQAQTADHERLHAAVLRHLSGSPGAALVPH